jgi:hypothetical protein
MLIDLAAEAIIRMRDGAPPAPPPAPPTGRGTAPPHANGDLSAWSPLSARDLGE